MRTIHVTNDELYEFTKLYDLLRDMDFELTSNQESVFEKVLEMDANSTFIDINNNGGKY